MQIERLPEIVAWKNEVARAELDPAYPVRLELPDGMTSGLYKYIVFDWLERSTGRVYDEPCHRIMGHDVELPNTDWVARNHSCVPLYYRPDLSAAHESSRHRRIGLHRLARSRQAASARLRAGDLRPAAVAVARARHVDTVLGSITDREALERALHSCDAVAHLAAVADVNDVHAEPEDAERVNARGTVTVLEAARRAGVKRIVYASTIWVYSDCEPEAVDEDTLLPAPSHLYTSTKLAGELYCKAYQELYGIDYTILRFGIPYGPRAREAAVIPAFVNKALRGEPLTLAGDGSQSRRFVYVEDLADGVARGARRRGGQPRLQPRQRRERHDQADRRDRQGSDRRRRDRPHAGAARATSAARSCAASGPSASSGGRRRRRSPRACAATWSGAASRPRTPPSSRRPR